ncbi:MAG TPA: hypothetical protein VF816_10735 [Rhodocyclaceae bacterium]
MAMWSFGISDGWQQIDDFLAEQGVDDEAEQRRRAGFTGYAGLAVGDRRVACYCVEVFNRDERRSEHKAPQYGFLVVLDIGHVRQRVAVKELPDLLELMRQTVPLATSIDGWSMTRSRYDKDTEKEHMQSLALAI